MDDILASDTRASVAGFKKKYGLTNEEYTMIFDLLMPAIRAKANVNRYKNRHYILRNQIERMYDKYRASPTCAAICMEIQTILEKSDLAEEEPPSE